MAKILVADDEHDILEILTKKIAEAGYEVVSATDGQEALDKIYKEAPDVIILDIRMPKLDGFEVLQKLRAKPIAKKWQPVIIVSALGELEDMKKGYNLEADYYIVKPCDISAVLKGIETMLHLIPVRRLPGEMETPSA